MLKRCFAKSIAVQQNPAVSLKQTNYNLMAELFNKAIFSQIQFLSNHPLTSENK